MRYFATVVAIMLVLVGIVGWVEAAEAGKVGYIDLSRVFDEYNKTIDLDKELERKGEDKQAQREKNITKIKRLKDELELLSEEGRGKKQAIIDEKIRELQDFDRDTQTELKRERDAMVRDILQEIDKIIQEYGKKEGYDLILNNRVLLYGRKESELTNGIIKILNEQYKK